ncbi:YihY/virulence factor BrkB family protein [Bombilactobacillus thymidiniphilus]|uniref:YihY/virulence factor BrkB family protein n=1 Tax=Bombilactobacillus thymidiniphilus TaxID=2923363 RepID=A0ABY4PC35_9LACO|nr:YihY/virulence factor BrkB family protein [Bombilactobacillus thymidiniphilus]UQS83252.1 YihY/virulence factor BrkB family protein [Bombilactobacillus thymidiniphilus]
MKWTEQNYWIKKIIEFVKLVIQKINNGNLSLSSKAVVYYGLLSFFPLISLLGSVLPLFNIDRTLLTDQMALLMPKQLNHFVEPIIVKLLTQKSGGLLSFGILGTLWSSSGLVNILKYSINEIYGLDNSSVYTKRSIVNYVILRLASILTTALFIVLVVAVMLILVIGQQFLDWVKPYFILLPNILTELLRWRWPLAVLMLLFMMILAYYFLPNSREKFRYLWSGSLFATFGFILLTLFFSLYVKYFGGRLNSYGTIGTFFILIIWLNLVAYIFLIGAAINAAMTQIKTGKIVQSSGLQRFQHK